MKLHFGLGTATLIDEVIVRWPGGRRRVLCDLPINQTHKLKPRNLSKGKGPLVEVERTL